MNHQLLISHGDSTYGKIRKLATCSTSRRGFANFDNNYQLLDEVEQNIVICRARADQLFADADGRGKLFFYERPTYHDILREPSSIILI